ncbi:hypothetical protein [Phocaeicola sartorii]|uniref:hypothetical protein n=1 Tax=Phocaeicola sartorii TaxID=671267 RepID=UPI00272CF4A1|nr:hypothetical protein [Phocaeicola sartorii]
MKKVYACLAGNWVCLNDDPECVMGKHRVKPSLWYEEDSVIYAPSKREKENAYWELDYVHIFYHNKDYRINPIFIQIVEE